MFSMTSSTVVHFVLTLLIVFCITWYLLGAAYTFFYSVRRQHHKVDGKTVTSKEGETRHCLDDETNVSLVHVVPVGNDGQQENSVLLHAERLHAEHLEHERRLHEEHRRRSNLQRRNWQVW